jgi:hypothetical protein
MALIRRTLGFARTKVEHPPGPSGLQEELERKGCEERAFLERSDRVLERKTRVKGRKRRG